MKIRTWSENLILEKQLFRISIIVIALEQSLVEIDLLMKT